MKNRSCIVCEKEIPHSERLDKKFCSIKCRNRHHNRNKSALREYRKGVSDSLEGNYKLLKLYLGKVVPLTELRMLGYNEKYFTHLDTKGDKVVGNAVWDLALQKVNEREVKIYQLQL